MDGRDIARVVQRAIALPGVEGDFAGHSLRAGFVTAASQKKVPKVDIYAGNRTPLDGRAALRRAAGDALRGRAAHDHPGVMTLW